ncbi:MAG: N-acetylmuramoyl-L-alanine amidase, partial [Actinobacteria bacterium]|nr:N-acetylmuramoyl-L-alanine amidase [Actinomycetota bacterium]
AHLAGRLAPSPMPLRFAPARSRLALVAALTVVVVSASFASAASGVSARTAARQSSSAVAGAKTFRAPGRVTHIAVHWRGSREARVWVALSRDGKRFGPRRRVQLDELAETTPSRETYGAVMVAGGVRAVRISSDRRLGRLTVLWLTDRGRPARPVASTATVGQPKVAPRVDWGANESLRYDSAGKEIWPAAFYPVQKLIVHHTATQNNDPDPAATVRSIYYYHAVTQGWGDIGYNFLIDEAGRIYEGRHTFDYPSGSSPTGEDAAGNGVTAAHAYGYNSGTVGIALLGTLTDQDATPAARNALEQLLAWESERHGIDPQGSGVYTNPVNGTQKAFANIAGHRDVVATECPGGVFYSTLPQTRTNVAARIAGSPTSPEDFSLSVSPTSRTITRGSSTTYTMTITPYEGFAASVSLSVDGLPGATTSTFSPNPATSSSTLSVQTSRSTPTGTYPLTIRGASGNLTRTTSATLQVKRK